MTQQATHAWLASMKAVRPELSDELSVRVLDISMAVLEEIIEQSGATLERIPFSVVQGHVASRVRDKVTQDQMVRFVANMRQAEAITEALAQHEADHEQDMDDYFRDSQ